MARKKNPTTAERAAVIRKDRHDILGGIGKELLLVGLYGVKELTGADLHTNKRQTKQSWEKKWGER